MSELVREEEMGEQLKEGDIVQLKSGSDLMTVERVSGDGLVHCVWFDEKNNIHTHAFPLGTLEKEKPNTHLNFAPDMETD